MFTLNFKVTKHYFLLFSLFASYFIHAQIIYFPDANFKAKLLQANSTNFIAYDLNENSILIDANTNNEIELSEIQNISGLNVNNSFISDLTGISNFINLKSLLCSNNSLTQITIDNIISLNAIDASHNIINSIAINFDDLVYSLDLSYNNLTYFSASSLLYEDFFDISHNQINLLELNNTQINNSSFSFNNLNEVMVSGNVILYGLGNLSHNQFNVMDLSEINFTNHFILTLGDNIEDVVLFNTANQASNIIYSSNNTTFDLGNFNSTTDCDPEYSGNITITNSPNLENVIFKNDFIHGSYSCNEGGNVFSIPAMNLQISNCPNLNHICVDQNPASELNAIQYWLNQLGLQNQVTVDSNCNSFVLSSEIFQPEEQLVISPVPAKNFLEIISKNNSVIISIAIFNNLGQIVQSKYGDIKIIDISNLSKGCYFIKIKTQEDFFVNQFMKD